MKSGECKKKYAATAHRVTGACVLDLIFEK
jgi:hypothetical protein